VIKRSKIRRPAIEPPRPSRIRREPPGRVPDRVPGKELRADPAERELWTVTIGVVLFTVAIVIITLGTSAITGS
jgi:hypothetical protein